MGFVSLDYFVATFTPVRRDDLKPEAEEWLGYRCLWQASWVIDEGPYQGDWACSPIILGDPRPSFAWVPERDLSDIEMTHQPDLTSWAAFVTAPSFT